MVFFILTWIENTAIIKVVFLKPSENIFFWFHFSIFVLLSILLKIVHGF